MDQAAAAVDTLDDASVARRLDLGLWIGWSEAVLERHQRAIEHCQRVIDISEATGQGAHLLVTKTAQAWAFLRTGQLAAAEDVLSAAIEAGRLAPNLFLSIAVGLFAVLATCKGEFEAALAAGEESVRLARRADPGLIPGMSGFYHAIPLLETCQPEQARAVLLAMSGGDPDLRTSRSGWTQAYELLTRAELDLGNLNAAADWARRAGVRPGGESLAVETTFAWRASAAVTLARGHPKLAAELALRAAARADEAGAPVEAGRCRILAGRALIRAGERSSAANQLDTAVRGLGLIGAHGYWNQAQDQLRNLTGDGPATAPPEEQHRHWESLTRSERAVVDLVAQGLTNPEVADRLCVSRHTVKRHLANAMQKVGINSRVVLAREASLHRK